MGNRGCVASFDSSGTHRWSTDFVRSVGSGPAGVSSVAIDGHGNVFVGGGFGSPCNFGSGLEPWYGDTDMVVASYDTNGVPRWSRTYGGSLFDAVQAMAYEPATDRVYAAGIFAGTVDFGVGSAITASGGSDVVLLTLTP
jgi:outer membrane protein assembly factor BamB